MRRINLLIAGIVCAMQLSAQIDLLKLQKEYMARNPALDSMYGYPDVKFDSIRTMSSDRISISFWWMPKEKKKGTVLLVHGFQMNKSAMLPRAKIYYNLGFNVIVMDLRARGQSGGQTATSGPEVRNDVIAVMKYYEGKLSEYGPLILVGFSHGARAVVFAVERNSSMVKAVILESIPFSLAASFKRTYKMDPPPIPEGNISEAFQTISGLPTLLMTGRNDQVIIPDEAEKIKGFFKNEKSRLIIFENAGHDLSGNKDSLLYHHSIQSFLQDITSGSGH